MLERVAVIVIGAVLLAGGLASLAMAGYAVMPDAYPPEQRLVIIDGVGLVVGVVLAMAGARRIGHGR